MRLSEYFSEYHILQRWQTDKEKHVQLRSNDEGKQIFVIQNENFTKVVKINEVE